MKFFNSFSEIRNGQRRLKHRAVMIISVMVFAVFVFFTFILYYQNAESRRSSGLFLVRPKAPPKKIDYNLIQIEPIPIGEHLKKNKPASQPVLVAKPKPQIVKSKAQSKKKSQAVKSAPSYTRAPRTTRIDRNPNMIVYSSIGSDNISSRNNLGLQRTLVKVILPAETSVTNSSLIQARVMKSGRWGNIEILKRSQLLGVVTLQNSRVEVQFNQLRIGDITYSCTGRAFDLKLIPGLQYTPLSDRTRQVVLDELKSAAAAIPVIGRYTNQPDLNPFNQEVTTLEEGLEFYAQITNVF